MIRQLSIRNYAIIDELDIHFSEGLTMITGETGAGKSILLGALGLIMGKRADTKVLYHTDRKCIIEGFFAIDKYELKRFFEENELDYDPELVIRREISPSGKSRAFINDTPVTLNVLQALTASLVDLHQQFDTLDIQEESLQLRMLDALAGNKRLLADYKIHFEDYQANKRSLNQLQQAASRSSREQEFLQFQLDEFEKAGLEEGEQESLEEELALLNNAEEIRRISGLAFVHLSDSEQSIVSQLQELSVSIGQISSFHSDIQALSERLQSALVELEDLAGELENVAEDTEHNPGRQQEVQERLDLIYRLQAKHQVNSIEELLQIQDELQQQIEAIGDQSAEIERLKKRIAEQEKELKEMSEMLREKRITVIPEFEQKVKALLAELSMGHAVLKVEVSPLEEFTATGADAVQFLFSANVGSRLQSIRDVASGGELSRLALVTKSLVASAIPLPTLIFDEIDTGISGDVALKMGRILRKLSDEHQVVSITHSPQVASKADTHYFVFKKVKEDRTVTNVRELNEDERIRAIAVMLSSNPPSESALQNARELVKE
jgi:DNA repair protein RecN (Recombination protein N)